MIDGTTGLLCEAGDVASLAAALEKLIIDTSLRSRFGRAGRAHVAQTFTLQRMANKFAAAVSS